jgi:hypothetical protein
MVAVLIALIAAVVVLALGAAYVTVLVSLATIGLALWVVGLTYAACFFGFYFLLGEHNLGWVTFSALFIGGGLVSALAGKAKKWAEA